MTLEIIELDQSHLDDLADLLVDAVAHGASVGFMHPFTQAEARSFWAGRRDVLVLGALLDGRLVGTASLGTGLPPNQVHRAEVSKVLVHSSARRQGFASLLMAALEQQAERLGRWVLVLDTVSGTPAQVMYEGLGYTVAGVIPDYAAMPEGGLVPTTVLYKNLRDTG